VVTVDEALRAAHAQGLARLDAQLLIARYLQSNRAWVLAHGDAPLAAADIAALALQFSRRADGEPLAYLLGEREFHGLLLEVGPDVLVPRPETETLVDWALELLHGPLAPRGTPCGVDLGTGSGAIALAVKHACPRIAMHGSDLSAAALSVARRNAVRLGLAVEWHGGAWWEALGGQRFDLALTNPPYIAARDPHLAALTHEPALALTPAGDDGTGLADLRRLISDARPHLLPDGWLLLEHGHDQGAAVRELLGAAGFDAVCTRRDLAGQDRVSGGRRRT
jgi:release factor glutamine methyltransferase